MPRWAAVDPWPVGIKKPSNRFSKAYFVALDDCLKGGIGLFTPAECRIAEKRAEMPELEAVLPKSQTSWQSLAQDCGYFKGETKRLSKDCNERIAVAEQQEGAIAKKDKKLLGLTEELKLARGQWAQLAAENKGLRAKVEGMSFKQRLAFLFSGEV